METFRILLPLFLVVVVQGSSCQFPSYLTDRTRWESRISLNRRSTDVYWKFHDHTLEIIDLTGVNEDTAYHQCHSELPDKKYVVLKEEDGVTSYQCLQFIVRSNQVVQFQASPVVKEVDFEADVLCADDALQLDPWPLVWPGETDTYHACPLTGGYDFHITDNKNKETTCAKSHLKPRMESECMTGEGLTLDFRTFDCRGRVEMEVKQTLYCLGTWSDDDFTYSVVTDNDDLWPKLWLLRFPRIHGSEFSARLYNDILVDSKSALSENYFELHFQRAEYPSLCENEASPCNDCDANNAFYCQKTCHTCDALRNVNSCEFDVPSQGNWEEVSHQGNRDIQVTSNTIRSEAILPLQCFDLHTDFWYEDKNYRAVATVFKNGCKPRYTCVEFQRVSAAVLLYRISQNLVWPHKLVLSGQDVCAEEQFQDDPEPLASEFRSKHLRPLLKQKTAGQQHHPTASCGLSGKFLLDARMTQNNMTCTAYLESCQSSHSFSLQTGTECTGTMATVTHHCLASFEIGGTTMIVTNTQAANGDNYCWAFYKEAWDSVYSLYLLYASDCHSDIGRYIKYYNFRGHLAEFVVQMGSGDLGSHSCNDDFPEMLPATVDLSTVPSTVVTLTSTDLSSSGIHHHPTPTPPVKPIRTTRKPDFPSSTRHKLPTTTRVEKTTPAAKPFPTRWATHSPTIPPKERYPPTGKKTVGKYPQDMNQYQPVSAALKSRGAAVVACNLFLLAFMLCLNL